METLGDRVKKMCKENGISQSKIEKECGLAKGYVSKMDSSSPSAENIGKIARILNSSTDYLILGEKTEARAASDAFLIESSDKVASYAEKLSKLSYEKQEQIMSLIDMLDKEK